MEEIKKVDILSKMFHRCNLEQLTTLWSMADAVISYDQAKEKELHGPEFPPEGTKVMNRLRSPEAAVERKYMVRESL